MDEILGRTQGWAGWSPVPAIADRGDDKVMVIADFVGGEDNKPISEIGKYVGLTGLVTDIAGAVALPKGAKGDKPVTSTTSITSNSIATGTKSFILDTPIDLVLGQVAKAYSLVDPTNYVCGFVSAISPTALDINVTETGGSGSKTDWVIISSSFRGTTGITTPNIPTNRLAGRTTAGIGSVEGLEPVGLTLADGKATVDYTNPLSAYNASSGVDTELTNEMSPKEMFQNLAKHNKNQFTNTELANPLGAIMIASPGPLGVLIRTNIVTSIDQWFTIDLKAHSYSPTELPIDIHIEGEVRPGAMDFYNNIGLSKGKPLDGNLYMLQIDGKVCIWFPLNFIQTFYPTCFTSDNRKNRVTAIELTSASMPTADVGGIEATLINVNQTIVGNGSSSNLILGNGTPKPVSDFILATEKEANNGVATLDSGGKVPTSQLPALAITDTFPVASQALMLALSAQVGDVAIRSDINKTFILRVEPATTLANWSELLNPTDAVTSVAGKTGVVTLVGSDITEDSTHRFATDTEKTSWNNKAPIRYEAITAISSNITLALTDENDYLRISGTRNITVPPNSTVAFPIGARIDFLAVASAVATFVQGSGVTINKKTDLILTGFGACTLVKTGTDTWDLIGNN